MYNVRCPVGLMLTGFISEKTLDKYTHWVYNRVDERRNINKRRLDMKNYFEVKKNIVLTETAEFSITGQSIPASPPMISSLRWNGYVMTRWMRMECSPREIALAPDRIVKLRRVNDHRTGITSFYKFEGDNGGEKGKLGTIWGGEVFDDRLYA